MNKALAVMLGLFFVSACDMAGVGSLGVCGEWGKCGNEAERGCLRIKCNYFGVNRSI